MQRDAQRFSKVRGWAMTKRKGTQTQTNEAVPESHKVRAFVDAHATAQHVSHVAKRAALGGRDVYLRWEREIIHRGDTFDALRVDGYGLSGTGAYQYIAEYLQRHLSDALAHAADRLQDRADRAAEEAIAEARLVLDVVERAKVRR